MENSRNLEKINIHTDKTNILGPCPNLEHLEFFHIYVSLLERKMISLHSPFSKNFAGWNFGWNMSMV